MLLAPGSTLDGRSLNSPSSQSTQDGLPHPLLAELAPELKGKKCLVLDLDETLVHSSFKVSQLAAQTSELLGSRCRLPCSKWSTRPTTSFLSRLRTSTTMST